MLFQFFENLINYCKIEEILLFFKEDMITNYMRLNKVELTLSLWLYTIHGKNAEIIHLIEENQIKPVDEFYNECLIESIKCHHYDIANYILDQLLIKDKNSTNDILIYIKSSSSVSILNKYF